MQSNRISIEAMKAKMNSEKEEELSRREQEFLQDMGMFFFLRSNSLLKYFPNDFLLDLNIYGYTIDVVKMV